MLETEHKLHILTPLLWPSRCVLFSWCWGPLHWGFPRAPSVRCDFHYHIWSLLSGTLLATASGVSEVPLGRVWPSLPHLVSNSLGVCWQLHRGFSECPLGRVWPSLPHLVSNPLGVCWQLHRGFPRSTSVGCGFPYHIWSLLSGILLTTASGVSEVPLGRVWPSLPHLLSNSLGVCWQLLWDPNSTELNNNSTPTRSLTGSLKSNV